MIVKDSTIKKKNSRKMKTTFFVYLGHFFFVFGFLVLKIDALLQQQIIETRSSLCLKSYHVRPTNAILLHASSKSSDQQSTFDETNFVYSLLATDRDQKPNRGNFFYNDEVISHLYGYMYLVGFFFAQDPLFLGSFLIYSILAAWATQSSILPANPRVPGAIACFTLATTLTGRYLLGYEPSLEPLLGDQYQGPTDYALLLECLVCFLNASWGFFGRWQSKEQIDGATYGF
jgi:hypothetical protein